MDEVDVQQRARFFISPLDLTNISIDLSVYAEAANAKLRFQELAPGESGYSVTRPNGQHVITVNKLESPRRQRFTICHEMAHLVLKLPSSHEEVPLWSAAKRDVNEILCDVFAAELLMPYGLWLRDVPEGEPSEEIIQHMADAFVASFQTAASRYASLSTSPCAYVTMSAGVVRYAARSLSLRKRGAIIPPRSPIPQGSVSYRIRESRLAHTHTETVAQDLWFRDWDRGYDMSEMARNYPRFDETIALLWFDDEDMPEVEINRFGQVETDDGGLAELTGELPWPSKRRKR